ncbi:MAG: SAM-dependent methyltransferase [Oligoflexus sp.]
MKPNNLSHKPQSPFDIATYLLADEASTWGNLGDWQEASDYVEACRAHARALGRVCQLKTGDRVLDLAFGWGASLALWGEEFQVSRVDGIELRQHCVDWVKAQKAPATGSIMQADWHECFRGGKPAAIFPELGVYDAIVCVDALYHCSNLDELLLACNLLLKAQGHFAATTLIHVPQQRSKWWQPLLELAFALARIRPKAQISQDQLVDIFVQHGFHAPVVQWLDQPVLLGFASFIQRRRRQLPLRQRLSLSWLKIAATAWLCRLALASGEWRYALLHAQTKQP